MDNLLIITFVKLTVAWCQPKNPIKTRHPKVFRSNEPFIVQSELVKEINVLKEHIKNNDLESILNNLKKIVIDYYPNRKIIDHTFMKK